MAYIWFVKHVPHYLGGFGVLVWLVSPHVLGVDELGGGFA